MKRTHAYYILGGLFVFLNAFYLLVSVRRNSAEPYHVQEYACKVWRETCNSGLTHSPDKALVNCFESKSRCDTHYLLVATGTSLVALVAVYNPISYMPSLCPEHSVCRYITLKSYDAILGFVPWIIGGAVLLWVYLKSKRRRRQQQQMIQARSFNPANTYTSPHLQNAVRVNMPLVTEVDEEDSIKLD